MSQPQLYFTSLEFLERFTASERLTVWTVAQTDADVADILMLGLAAQGMMNDDPRTLQLMSALVAKGILTAERRDAILYG